MAVPALTHACWQKLAGGKISTLQTKHLATQLLIKRLERAADPVAAKAAELHEFFTRWESALGAEIKQLTTL